MSAARLARLSQSLSESDLDALALLPGPNLTYLTGLRFHLFERPILALFFHGRDPFMIVPELEQARVQEAGMEIDCLAYGEQPDTWPQAFAEAARRTGLESGRVGVEPTRMRYLEFDLLRQAAPGADFQSAASILDPLREIKEPGEIESMQRAVLVAEQALQATLPQIQVGMTESELAAELFAQLLRAGSAPEIPFSPIVAGGPNSALPHHDPGERKLAPGDLLIIDWGATVDGYVSDITRTFAVAEIDPALVPAYQAVQEANRAGRQAARPGVSCGDLDRAARQVIDEAGFGAYFIHRLGHGLGLEGHEPPYLRGDNRALFQAGMTFTVEPGVYLSGRGGVRIEDDVVITEQGATSLTTLDRDLRVVGTG